MKQCRPIWRITAIGKQPEHAAVFRQMLEFALLAVIGMSAMRLHDLLSATIQ